jgi:hypothetical protein
VPLKIIGMQWYHQDRHRSFEFFLNKDNFSFKIERVENKVIQPISKYDEFLKNCKNTIKSTIAVRDKEKKKQQQLNAILQKTPENGRNIVRLDLLY